MVPHVFPLPTAEWPIDLFAMMEPAHEVGGDLYDFFTMADGRLCFLVGDVSGKGMPASLFMARTKSLIRIATELMRSPDGGPATPADIIGRVNRELSENNDDMMFVTLFLAMLDATTGEISFCNAGHNPPYRLKASQLAEIDEPRGIILGVRPEAVHATGRLTLAPGETIFLFTDGVTEANNRAGELFSKSRLEIVLRRASRQSSADVVEAVAAELRGFVGTAQPSDDITMLAVRKSDGVPAAPS
jgi:sigma-B regulation protein RsbU (phosphoserine phosphatase)